MQKDVEMKVFFVIINLLFLIFQHQTQQNLILQTNDSYMPVQDISLQVVLSLRAKIKAPVS